MEPVGQEQVVALAKRIWGTAWNDVFAVGEQSSYITIGNS